MTNETLDRLRTQISISLFFAAVDAAIDVIEENFLPLSPLPEEAGDTGLIQIVDITQLQFNSGCLFSALNTNPINGLHLYNQCLTR